MVQYHQSIPAGCPPTRATPVNGEVYRGVRRPPLTENDFLSFNEIEGHRDADHSDCKKWGISCWMTLEEVKNARKLNKYMRRWQIVVGTILPNEAVCIPTPNDNNPGHQTLWVDKNTTFASKFAVALQPNED